MFHAAATAAATEHSSADGDVIGRERPSHGVCDLDAGDRALGSDPLQRQPERVRVGASGEAGIAHRAFARRVHLDARRVHPTADPRATSSADEQWWLWRSDGRRWWWRWFW